MGASEAISAVAVVVAAAGVYAGSSIGPKVAARLTQEARSRDDRLEAYTDATMMMLRMNAAASGQLSPMTQVADADFEAVPQLVARLRLVASSECYQSFLAFVGPTPFKSRRAGEMTADERRNLVDLCDVAFDSMRKELGFDPLGRK